MEVYQIEEQIVEQKEMWKEIRKFVGSEAMALPLHEVELKLFRMLMPLGLSLLKEVVAGHGDGRVEGTLQRENGTSLPCHSVASRDYLSVFGEIKIARAYYWKEGCGEGLCPLDAMLNLPAGKHSYLLEKWIMADVARGTYDEAIERIGGILGLTLWKREQVLEAQRAAADADTFYARKAAPGPDAEGPVICATADCKGVRMIPSEKPDFAKPASARLGKGEKTGLRRDAVVTSDFSFFPGARDPEEMARRLLRMSTQREKDAEAAARARRTERGEVEPRAPINQQRAATMFGKEKAFKDLADRIQKRDPGAEKPIYVLIDGEQALENGLANEFKARGWNGRLEGYCLDIFHVMEYVWEAGTALHGEKNPEREKWVHRQTLSLLSGRAGRVAGGLRQIATKRGKKLRKSQIKSLHKAANYLDNHSHMMRYDIYLEKGYPIGTGVIEGACGSLVKQRMDGSGKRWSKVGAQNVLNLRSTIQNNDWDNYWDFHISLEKNRLYVEKAA